MAVTAQMVRDANAAMAAEPTRAERDREITRLERKLAYQSARSDVENQVVRGADGEAWFDITGLYSAGRAISTVRYLELRRLLRRHHTDSHLVQVKDWL
jgi:hypothetical protein